jgi:hypothetical protein
LAMRPDLPPVLPLSFELSLHLFVNMPNVTWGGGNYDTRIFFPICSLLIWWVPVYFPSGILGTLLFPFSIKMTNVHTLPAHGTFSPAPIGPCSLCSPGGRQDSSLPPSNPTEELENLQAKMWLDFLGMLALKKSGQFSTAFSPLMASSVVTYPVLFC